MKLAEIYKSPHQPTFGVDSIEKSFDMQSGTQIARAEGGLPVLMYHAFSNKNTVLCAIQKDNLLVAKLIGSFATVNGIEYLIGQRTWTEPEYRRQGLMIALYIALTKHAGFRLMSDKEQSPETIQLWKKLSSIRPVKVYDTTTGQIIDRENVPDNELYSTTEVDNYRLILEYVKPANFISEVDNSILADYINYTHPDNCGKYE